MTIRFFRHLSLLAVLLTASITAGAQRFVNLTSDQVRVDTVLPHFSCSIPLSGQYADSTYTCSILYPEFIDMTSQDIRNYRSVMDRDGSSTLSLEDRTPALPVLRQTIAVERKRGALEIQMCPIVYRDGKYQLLVSFMLRVDAAAKPLLGSATRQQAPARTQKAASGVTAADRYAAHSVLANGRWAKIRVPSTGVYQLTDALIRRAGFTDLSRVKIYGYGGNLQNETLTAEDLIAEDDLKEVATCKAGDKRLFYAKGPVSWESNTATRRTRNPYSDYGYYFLTESDAEPLSVDSATFVSSFYPSADDYHSLYEQEGYSWYQGGRNLFDPEATAAGSTRKIVLTNPALSDNAADRGGTLSVCVAAATASRVSVSLNGTTLGELSITLSSYDAGNQAIGTWNVDQLLPSDTVSITCTSGGPIRLDYTSMAWKTPKATPRLSAITATPEYVYNITPQDHHADPAADMVIIIPTSQKYRDQAERLAAFHESHDAMRVNIVPADELYNEFSSGTPDANAYRRYLKMLYDRATTEADMPRYLLLMGDCMWDNRMLTPACSNLSADDYLLCYESENSFNDVYCYVDDGFFALLDDGEGGNPLSADKLDVAVGRLPVTTANEAKNMVDKIIRYAANNEAGDWQNTIMFMGDDGNSNIHMRDVNAVADDIAARYPGFLIKKVMWDAYNEETSSTGNRYPEVSALIKAQQQAGALIMDYGGHGIEYQISHERVLELNDFKTFTNTHLPLWITASCDIMPFDGTKETIGEQAVLNAQGGAIAFFGTARTVITTYNKEINHAFLNYVLSLQNGKPTTIGEAQRLAKNQMITDRLDLTCNKLQYALLGDPALALPLPTLTAVVDSINGEEVAASALPTMKAGQRVRISGHIENAPHFTGLVSITVRDSRELITCKMNNSAETDTPFTFYDRQKTLFQSTDSIRDGRFDFQFTVPIDINYSDESGLINLYAVGYNPSSATSSDNAQPNESTLSIAHGAEDRFLVGGTDIEGNDSTGPKIFCYLNTPEFQDGGTVNATPFFVAKISDSDGINVTGNGIGHDLQLIIDNDAETTYTLNDNFSYDFGSFTEGTTYYSIPTLEPGDHTLLFRAWDVLNNPSTATLRFRVKAGLQPTLYDINAIDNPATTSTTFIVSHDFQGSATDITIEVFDTTGRLLWHHVCHDTTPVGPYTYSWNLTQDDGHQLDTGVYLYRVRISCSGGDGSSKTKKLIVIR